MDHIGKPSTCFRDLAEQDVRDNFDTGLEQALCRADFFRENNLQLFRDVCPTLLYFTTRGMPWRQDLPKDGPASRGDYLLCRGKQALVCFDTSPEPLGYPNLGNHPDGFKTLHFQRGKEAWALDLLEKAVSLTLRRRSDLVFPMKPVPAKFWPQLVREGLVEQHRGADGQLFWDISRAGQAEGLFWGRYAEGQALREGPFWSDEDRKRLEPIWSRAIAPHGKQRSLDVRLRELNTGRYVRRVVECFAQTPLGTYLRDYPEELDRLEDELGVGFDTPFHEAAALIQERLVNLDNQIHDEGVNLMSMLARPLVEK